MLLLMSHSSVVPLRIQCAEWSGSNTQPVVSNGRLTLNRPPTRTNCHSQVLSVAGNVGYVQSVAGMAGVSCGNHDSVFTTLNCIRTLPMFNPGGNGSGDGLPTNIVRFSLKKRTCGDSLTSFLPVRSNSWLGPLRSGTAEQCRLAAVRRPFRSACDSAGSPDDSVTCARAASRHPSVH